jgi:four helix bundle protein
MEETAKYQSFTELNVWKEARSFQLYIFELCKNFPSEEKYKLCDQLIRSSRSIAANIAEGHGRFHFQEQIQFCRQARGSLSEVLNHIYTAFDCKYIQEEKVKEIKYKSQTLLKLINGYLFFLKNQKQTNQQNQHNKLINKP